MTTKSDFNAEEWETLVHAPLLAGIAVMASERGGTLRETLAISKVYAAAREQHGESPLLDELVASPPALDPNDIRESGGGVEQLVSTRLRDAVATVEATATPEEAQAYKRFVLSVAEAAAAAHKEGGFIGIGGKPVSESEQAALDRLRTELGLTG